MEARYFVVTWYVDDDDPRSDEGVQAEMMQRLGFPMIEPLFGDEARTPAPSDAPVPLRGRRARPLPRPRAAELADSWRSRVTAPTERALQVADDAVATVEAMNELYGEQQDSAAS